MTKYDFDPNSGDVYERDIEEEIARDKEREDYLADHYGDLWREEHNR